MEEPQEDLLVVHCFCICGDGALFGGLLAIRRSVECNFCLSYLILGYFWSCFFLYCYCILSGMALLCFIFSVIFSVSQLFWFTLMTPLPSRDYLHRDQIEECVFFVCVTAWSSRGSVVKVADLCSAILGSVPTGTHMSHWWRQKEHLSKIAPVCQ